MDKKTIDITENITSMVESNEGVNTKVVEESFTLPEPTPVARPASNTTKFEKSTLDFLKATAEPDIAPKKRYKESRYSRRDKKPTLESKAINYDELFNNQEFRNMLGNIINDVSKKAIGEALKDTVDDVLDLYEESFKTEEEDDDDYVDYDFEDGPTW